MHVCVIISLITTITKTFNYHNYLQQQSVSELWQQSFLSYLAFMFEQIILHMGDLCLKAKFTFP